jgi:chromosome partitioning protein
VASAIITVATMKGGSGKSTLASCLAVHWQLNGRTPTIIDADPQCSIGRLAARERKLAGVPVVEDATENGWNTAQRAAAESGPVIIDTPGFRSPATLAYLHISDFVVVPVKPSPFDVDRMLDTLKMLLDRPGGRQVSFRCLLSQTTRDSIIARHIRSELVEAGFPVLRNEMSNRVAYAESALWGATPTMMDRTGAAARDIAAIADEIDFILAGMFDNRQAASA